MIERAEQLIGTWRLVRYVFAAPSGEERPHWPGGATGLLHYGGDGRMSAHLMALGRPDPGPDLAAAPPETLAAATGGYVAYAGPWRLEGGRVAHEVEVALHPGWPGRTLWRDTDWDGERLRLTARPLKRGGETGEARLDWVRA